MPEDRTGRIFIGVIIIAIAIKLSLFLFAAVHAPQGKFLPDSYDYLKLSEMLVSHGAFAVQDGKGALIYETFRTPGYPAFLAIFHGIMKIPLDGIILLQVVMTLLAAFITYRAALEIDRRTALLSMTIILFDLPITIFSLTVLTETLFMLLLAIFMFGFTLYLKHRRIGYLIVSALFIVLAAYVRPIGYYLGFAVSVFIIYANRKERFTRSMRDVFIFLVIVYSMIGIWQVRNYVRCNNISFSSVERLNLSSMGLLNSYSRNTDPYTKGLAPLPYYANVSSRCLMSLMTRPGNLKYLGCDILTNAGKIFGYTWMALWMSGFVWGILKIRDSIIMQFMLLAVIYFAALSVCAAMWVVGERFRVPMMPFIAIISAYGWRRIFTHWKPEH